MKRTINKSSALRSSISSCGVGNSGCILCRELYRMLFIRTKLAMTAVPNRRLAAAAEKGGELEGFKFGANVPISAQPYFVCMQLVSTQRV